MTTSKPPKPVFRLDLTPTGTPGDDGTQRLRRALKALLRFHGLRCLKVEQIGEPGEQDAEAVTDES